MTRYIKLHDSILQWQWFHDANTLRLWIYLLLNASYKETQFMGRTLQRGQCLVSVRQLSDRLHISVNTVNRSLRILRNDNCIAIENAGSLGSVISVVNYANYQGVSENDTATDTVTDTVTDTATDTQSKKVYKEKEIYKEKDIVADDAHEGWQASFIDSIDNQWRDFVSQELRMPLQKISSIITPDTSTALSTQPTVHCAQAQALMMTMPDFGTFSECYTPDRQEVCAMDLRRTLSRNAPTLYVVQEAYGRDNVLGWVSGQLATIAMFTGVHQGDVVMMHQLLAMAKVIGEICDISSSYVDL